MSEYTKKSRLTSSKKACKCTETGVQILKFEQVLYDPSTKSIYSQSSNKYKEYITKEQLKLKFNK